MNRKLNWGFAIVIAVSVVIFFIVKSDTSQKRQLKPTDSTARVEHKALPADANSNQKIIEPDKPLFEQADSCRQDYKLNRKALLDWHDILPEYIQELSQVYGLDHSIKALMAVAGERVAAQVYNELYQQEIRTGYRAFDHSSVRQLVKTRVGERAFKNGRIHWAKVPEAVINDISEFAPEYMQSIIAAERFDLSLEEILPKVVELSRDYIGMRASIGAGENILESLALANQPELLKLYFRHGGQLKQPIIGLNALEKILFDTNQKQLSKYSVVISELTRRGLVVRYRVLKDKGVKFGQVFDYISHYSQSDLYLLESYGFVFKAATTEASTKENTIYQALAEQISGHRNAFLDKGYALYSMGYYSACEALLGSVQNKIANPEKHEQANRLLSEHANNVDQINEALFKLEPGLTDCVVKPKAFKKTEVSQTSVRPRYDDIENIVRLRQNTDIHQAIAAALPLNLTEEEKERLFIRLTGRNTDSVPFLFENGLLPESFSMSEVYSFEPEQMEALTQLGYDFNKPTDTNRNVVEGAVTQCNASLLQWLAQNDFTYQFSELRSDALAIAIRTQCFNIRQRRIDLISAVMAFNPSVKEYHRQRMAELRLQDYPLFKTLTEMFPQLSISESQSPSGYFCRIISHSTNHYSSGM